MPVGAISMEELIDGFGAERAKMIRPAITGLRECDPGFHCCHHGEIKHPCCKCGAMFKAAPKKAAR